MGFYIETPNSLGKAKQLTDWQGAELVLTPEKFDFSGDYALICVVENGPFDAAGIAFDARERDAFNQPDDPRPKTWLKLPKARVLKLCPRAKHVLI